MKLNGATFNKAQQDQLKKKIGAELEAVVEKANEAAKNSLRYAGIWTSSTKYHKNDVVTKGTGIFIAQRDNTHSDPSNNEETWKPAPSLKPQSIGYTSGSTTGTAYRAVLSKIKEIVENYSSSYPNRGYNGELLIVANVDGATLNFVLTDYNGDKSATALCITARTGNIPTLYVIHLTNDAGGKAWKLDFSSSPLSMTEIGAPTNVGLTFAYINF